MTLDDRIWRCALTNDNNLVCGQTRVRTCMYHVICMYHPGGCDLHVICMWSPYDLHACSIHEGLHACDLHVVYM